MLPPVKDTDTCSSYWTRLTPDQRDAARTLQENSDSITMTAWLLNKGCRATFQPHKPSVPPPAVPRVPLTHFYPKGATRRPAGHIR